MNLANVVNVRPTRASKNRNFIKANILRAGQSKERGEPRERHERFLSPPAPATRTSELLGKIGKDASLSKITTLKEKTPVFQTATAKYISKKRIVKDLEL